MPSKRTLKRKVRRHRGHQRGLGQEANHGQKVANGDNGEASRDTPLIGRASDTLANGFQRRLRLTDADTDTSRESNHQGDGDAARDESTAESVTVSYKDHQNGIKNHDYDGDDRNGEDDEVMDNHYGIKNHYFFCDDEVSDDDDDDDDDDGDDHDGEDDEVDDDEDFPDCDSEACALNHDRMSMMRNIAEKRCDFCRAILAADTKTEKCLICHKAEYCNATCKKKGQTRHKDQCDKLRYFSMASGAIYDEMCLQKLYGRDMVTLDGVPSLGQASLGGSKATVLLEIVRRRKAIKQTVNVQDAYGRETVVEFRAKDTQYNCLNGPETIQLELKDLLKLSNFIVLFGAFWTRLSGDKVGLVVDDVTKVLFFRLTISKNNEGSDKKPREQGDAHWRPTRT